MLFSRHVEPFDVNTLLALGIDPMQKRYVMLKSRIHWRAGMAHLAKAVVECAGVGVCTSDYAQHQFKKLRRPIYPLDACHRHGLSRQPCRCEVAPYRKTTRRPA